VGLLADSAHSSHTLAQPSSCNASDLSLTLLPLVSYLASSCSASFPSHLQRLVMPTFEELMALSASQTKQAESELQRTINERKQKELQKRKAQEERERKDRELAARQRELHFEKQKREKEEAEKLAKSKQAKELAMQRRADEQRDHLLYGPKKAKASASSGSGSSSPRWPSKKRNDDEDDGVFVGSVLTREEKREAKLQQELNRSFNSAKRSTKTGGYMKANRRLPGGAVDIVTTSTPSSQDSTLSVKERIAAAPNGLQRLNVVKRDRRTIDEYHTDMKARKSQVIQGDEAKTFNEWFSTKKKPELGRPSPAISHSPSPSRVSSPALAPPTAAATVTKSKPSATTTISKSTAFAASSASKPTIKSSAKPSGSRPSTSSASSSKKRHRSPSRSISPPPKRRKETQPAVKDDIRSAIWSMFGKDRTKYVGHDDFSDESDMEADASVLEREERQRFVLLAKMPYICFPLILLCSTRVARLEDEAAARELKRHEEEKRRRKIKGGA
jgi:protein SPT2